MVYIPPGEVELPDAPFFDKETRGGRYNGRFSIRLTEAELNAYRVRVVVRPLYVPFRVDQNYEYNPPKGVYLRGTAHDLDVGVVRSFLVHWYSSIIFEWRNEGMLTRFWSNVLTAYHIRTNAYQVLPTADGLSIIPGFVPIYAAATVAARASLTADLQGTDLFLAPVPPGVDPIIPVLGFIPPESLWKFTPDRPGIWSEYTVESWTIGGPFGFMPIGVPSPEDEDSDSQYEPNPNVPGPSPGEPPDPADESPVDTRNDPADYDTAPDPEDPEETEPYQIRVVITGSFGTTINSTGQQIANSAGEIVGCGEALSEPAPTIVSDSNYQNLEGWVGWTVNYTDLSGNPRKRFVGDGGPDRTTYGSPSVQVFEC